MRARRGDAFEGFLKRERDRYPSDDPRWRALDNTLDVYREHADIGVDIDYEIPEGEGWRF